jgi:hypothetical protein
MSEIHISSVPYCTTISEGICIRMKYAMYMDACILEFGGGE